MSANAFSLKERERERFASPKIDQFQSGKSLKEFLFGPKRRASVSWENYANCKKRDKSSAAKRGRERGDDRWPSGITRNQSWQAVSPLIRLHEQSLRREDKTSRWGKWERKLKSGERAKTKSMTNNFSRKSHPPPSFPLLQASKRDRCQQGECETSRGGGRSVNNVGFIASSSCTSFLMCLPSLLLFASFSLQSIYEESSKINRKWHHWGFHLSYSSRLFEASYKLSRRNNNNEVTSSQNIEMLFLFDFRGWVFGCVVIESPQIR